MKPRLKRPHKAPAVLQPTIGNRFKLKEKRAVFEALKRFQPNDIENIQKHYVPWREPTEVELFIKSMKQRSQLTLIPEVDVKEKAPIEHWLDVCEDLTHYDDDYSFMLSPIMSIIGSLEPHDSNSDTGADYGKIYNYLAAILRGQPAPSLPAFESAIILDIVTSISNRLKNLETGEQEQVLRHKYRLLSSLHKVKREDSWPIISQALEQDPLAPPAAQTVSDEASTSSAAQPQPQVTADGDISLKGNTTKSKLPQPAAELRPSKDPMFTLNPLYIPIKYLNMKEKLRNTANRDRIVKEMLKNFQLKITIVPTNENPAI